MSLHGFGLAMLNRSPLRYVLIAMLALYSITSVGQNGTSSHIGPNAAMADLWAGNAVWTYQRSWAEPFDSSHIEFYNGAWYLFERYIDNSVSGCPWGGGLGTQIRRSTDQGATWSAPVVAVAPTAGTAWGCSATDGDAIFDVANNKWRFLFQCLATSTSAWAGCYAERSGADPMGPFTPYVNPVITNSQLWTSICDVATDDCSIIPGGPHRVFDEGTFNIFQFDGTYYWVTFHGFDNPRGYRGMAKTTDFVNWIAGSGAQGLPTDAIFDRNDTVGWREAWINNTPIGGGAASIYKEGSFYYEVIEAADVNLNCTYGQHWDLGLMRTTSLTSTTWQQLPQGNPLFYSSRAADMGGQIPLCSIQYSQLFTPPDEKAVYIKFARVSGDPAIRQTFLYKLTKSISVLKNGDLWMGDASYWQPYPLGPTNMVVYRDPANASDFGQYLAANCGTYPQPCQAGQSFYQDVAVSNLGGQWLTFGGKFATTGGTGSMSLQVFQLDAAHNQLDSGSIAFSATPTYQWKQSASRPLFANTAYLRYQGYLNTSSVTYRADEMYADVAPSVTGCTIGTSWSQTSPGIYHVIGRTDLDGWSASTSLDAQGYLQYGPYTTGIPAGNHIAKWVLAIDNLAGADDPIVHVDVTDHSDSQAVLASRDVTRSQWSANGYNCFALPFILDASRVGHQIELRVFWYDRAYVREQKVGYD